MAKNKLVVYGMVLAMALSFTACGNGSDAANSANTDNSQVENTSQPETDNQSEEETTTMGRVTAMADNSITIMAMNFGNGKHGDRPNGTPPDGDNKGGRPSGTMAPDGEKPDGTMPADGEKPSGTMTPDGEKPDGTMPADMPKDGRGQGEEKTVIISDSTSIVKQNEDGTTETIDISEITEGTMIEITGTETDGTITATKIQINHTFPEC